DSRHATPSEISLLGYSWDGKLMVLSHAGSVRPERGTGRPTAIVSRRGDVRPDTILAAVVVRRPADTRILAGLHQRSPLCPNVSKAAKVQFRRHLGTYPGLPGNHYPSHTDRAL